MSDGHILVLGGGYFQARFVADAVRYGLQVTVLDRDQHCAVSQETSIEFQRVDIANRSEVESVARRIRPDFVYSPSTEVGNETAAHVSEVLGLPCNPVTAVAVSRDKRQQRALAGRLSGFRSPRAHLAGSEAANQLLDDVGAVVVKPAGESAGRGVRIAFTRQDLNLAVERAAAVSRDGGVLVEEHIEGEQFSVETVSVAGVHHIIGVTREYMSRSPMTIERSHLMGPDIHTKFMTNTLRRSIVELLDEIGVEVGPSHVEVISSGEDLALVEVATRAGGLRDQLMDLAGYGNFSRAIIDAYRGTTPAGLGFAPTRNAMCNILLAREDLSSVARGEAAGTLVDLEILRGPADCPQNIADAFGYAYFAAETDLADVALTDQPKLDEAC